MAASGKIVSQPLQQVNAVNEVAINSAQLGYTLLHQALDKSQAAEIFPSLAISGTAILAGLGHYQQTQVNAAIQYGKLGLMPPDKG